MKQLLVILSAIVILLQPFRGILDALTVSQQHYYVSTVHTLHGRPVIYCGDEESLHKKVQKDQQQRSSEESSDSQRTAVAFPLFCSTFDSYTAPLPSSVTQLLAATLQNKPVKGFHEIFHPPCNA